jgi:hypothetical protein
MIPGIACSLHEMDGLKPTTAKGGKEIKHGLRDSQDSEYA